MTECPTCGSGLLLGEESEIGQIISCNDCGTELEVLADNKVQPAPQEQEDWGE